MLPWGKIIGTAKSETQGTIGAATGVMQLLHARKEKKLADQSMPSLVDPGQAGFLAELNQKRKALTSGAEVQSGVDMVRGNQTATNEAITQNTGGDVGATISGLLGAENSANKGIGSIYSNAGASERYYTGAAQEMMNRISARKMELQLAQSSQHRAEWAQAKQDGMGNLQAGIANMVAGSKGNQKGNPQVSSPSATGQGQYGEILNGSTGKGGTMEAAGQDTMGSGSSATATASSGATDAVSSGALANAASTA